MTQRTKMTSMHLKLSPMHFILSQLPFKILSCTEYRAHTVSEIEEARSILRLFPIWASSLVYGVIFAQLTTFFTKQTQTLDRHLTSSLLVPPAALTCFGNILAYKFITYDTIFLVLSSHYYWGCFQQHRNILELLNYWCRYNLNNCVHSII